jgi:hypothetical protein
MIYFNNIIMLVIKQEWGLNSRVHEAMNPILSGYTVEPTWLTCRNLLSEHLILLSLVV